MKISRNVLKSLGRNKGIILREWTITSTGKAGSLKDACELVRAGSSSV